MGLYRYHKWDGSQDKGEVDRDDLMSQLSDYLVNYGNLSQALRMLTYRGLKDRSGTNFQGLRELLEQLRAKRREQVEKYDPASIFDDVRKQLQEIVKRERERVENRLNEARTQQEKGGEAQEMGRMLENIASKKKDFLDGLSKDPIEAIKQLTGYEFLDTEARRQFQELMEKLQTTMLESYFRNIQDAIQRMTPEQIDRLKDMTADLNQMLQEKMQGGEPDFQQFMDKYGDIFGHQKPSNLNELIERMQRQHAAMQSLMDSLRPYGSIILIAVVFLLPNVLRSIIFQPALSIFSFLIG